MITEQETQFYEHLANQAVWRLPCANCHCPRWTHITQDQIGNQGSPGCGACGRCAHFKLKNGDSNGRINLVERRTLVQP